MRFKTLLISAFTAVVLMTGCEKSPSVPIGDPSISVNPTTLDFEKDGAPQKINVLSNRDWIIEKDADWITVTPSEGKNSSSEVAVIITVDENAGETRSAEVTFTTGSASTTLTVNQDGIPIKHGDGSLENPFSAKEAIATAASLEDGAELPAYVRGIVSTIKNIDTSYGNAEYCISNDGSTENEFLIYRGYYLEGAKFTSTDQLKTGDAVIVYGKLVNFKGNTPEMTSGSKIISINGETPEPPKPITGENLLDNPGFETWNDAVPESWKEVSSNADIEKSTDFHSGSFSAKITGDTGGSSNKRMMSKIYKLKAGKYQLDAYAKGEGKLRIGYAVVGDDGKVATGDDYYYLNEAETAGADWTLFSGQFELSASTNISIVFMNSKTGNGAPFVVDDVSLVTENGGREDGGETQISVSPSTFNFPSTSGTQKVAVSAKGAWTASSDATGWLSINPAAGTGNAEVTIEVQENGGAARSAAITFTAEGGETATLTVNQAAKGVQPSGDGTLENPYLASEALTLAQTLDKDTKVPAYVKGKVSKIDEVNLQYGNATYYISDDGTLTSQFEIFRGKYLEGANFTAESQIAVGDELVVYGEIVNYQGKTPEMTTGSKIISTTNTSLHLTVNPESISVAATATSAEFNISSNAENWTCSASTGASVDVASGSGNGKVTVSFPENKDTEKAVTYTVTVTAGTLVKTVAITQQAVQSASTVTLTFPDENKDNNAVGSYTDTWTAISGGVSFSVANFNNNKWANDWAFIKCGRKADDSVATLTTDTALAAAITKVVVNVADILDAGKINGTKLEVSSDKNFATVAQTINVTLQKGDNEFVISSPAQNLYYRLTIDCVKHGTKNGIVTISKITYIAQ